MNKKYLIIVCGMLLASTGSVLAQKSKIREANRAYETAMENVVKINATSSDPLALNDKSVTEQLMKAKAAAEAATTNEETASNADAWFAKGQILVEMSRVPEFKSQRNYVAGLEALEKAIALNPKVLSRDGIENALFNIGIFGLNNVGEEMNKEEYDKMIQTADVAQKALTIGDGKLFKSNKANVDTLAITAEYYKGFGHYLKKDFSKAIEILEKNLKTSIGQSNSDAYRILAFAYSEAKNPTKQIQTIETAKAKFPGNKDIEIDELNYYIAQDKQNELVGRFESLVAKEPNNAQYIHNLGVLYRNMGMEKEGVFGADAEQWHNKAEEQLKKAVSLEPNNAAFNFNLSSLYVVKADLVGSNMNKLGTSKADNAKYDELLKVRTSLLQSAIAPLLILEKNLDPKIKSGKISNEERGYLFEGLQTLGRLYGATDDATNAKKYRDKLRSYEDGNFN